MSNLCNSRGSMPRKKYSPFSWIECLQLLQPDKRWTVLSSNVCGERAPILVSRNKLPARFPDDVVRVKRSFVQIFDGARSKGRLLQKTKSLLRRLV